jgi:hypothetical protein
VYRLSASGSIALQNPNGGETWPIGSSQTIRWTASSFSGMVRIELSRDGGATWAVLFSSTANDGAQAWKVTAPATNQALVRVSSVGIPSIQDTSNAVFSLGGGSISVLAPDGPEVWLTGTMQTIQWSTSGLTDNVRVELSRNGGATWATIIANTANDGAQGWKVTGSITAQARVRVSSLTNAAVADASNTNFMIGGYTVVTPNGGEVWPIGSRQAIRWASLGGSGNVRLQLSRDGGATWATIVSSTADDGQESWIVSGPATSQARMRVLRASQTVVNDSSDANFTLQ